MLRQLCLKRFSKLVTIFSIVQLLLLSTLITNANARVIKKREITTKAETSTTPLPLPLPTLRTFRKTENDPDIVESFHSNLARALEEGSGDYGDSVDIAAAANTANVGSTTRAESENVTITTKLQLMPSTSTKLVLNRITTTLATNDYVDTTTTRYADIKTQLMDESNTVRDDVLASSKVFSRVHHVGTAQSGTGNIPKLNLNDGLDNDVKDENEDFIEAKSRSNNDIVIVTTEGILADIEALSALKVNTTSDTKDAAKIMTTDESETATDTINQSELNLDSQKYATLAHDNVLEASSSELRGKTTNTSSEKRAKFINDNSTNAQQMNLPEAAEVWSLAGMKTVPQHNVSTQEVSSITAQEANDILFSTEHPTVAAAETRQEISNNSTLHVNSNSEKNLLDWSQIMRHGDLVSNKKFEQLIANSGSSTTEQNQYLASNQQQQQNVPETTTTKGEMLVSASTDLSNAANEIIHEQTTKATLEIEHIRPAIVETTTTSATLLMKTTLSTTSTYLEDIRAADTKLHAETTTESADNSDNSAKVITMTTSSSPPTTEERLADLENNISVEKNKIESNKAETFNKVSNDIALTLASTPATTTTTTTTTEASDVTTMARPEVIAGKSNNNAHETTTTTATTLKVNNKDDDDDDDKNDVGAAQAKTNVRDNVNDDTTIRSLENLSSSKTETTTILSMLEASNVNTSAVEDNVVIATVSNEYLQSEKTTKTAINENVTLPTILATHTKTTTETGQIGNNEVDLDLNTERQQLHGSSTIKTHLHQTELETTTTTTTSSINELFLNTTSAATTNAETTPATKEEFLTTTLLPLQVKETDTETDTKTAKPETEPAKATTSGSIAVVDENPTTTETPITTAAATVVDVKIEQQKPNGAASVEHESSLETNSNAIDPVDKSKNNNNDSSQQQPQQQDNLDKHKENQANSLSEEEQHNEDLLLTEFTTTMGTLVLNATATTITTTTSTTTPPSTTTTTTTTTEPPLISLLDDSTTKSSTTTTTAASISTKIEEIYSVFASTTTTTTTTTPIPATTTTEKTTSAPPTTSAAIETTVQPTTPPPTTTTTTTTTSTMLPPPTTNSILHASINGAVPAPTIPAMDGNSGSMHANAKGANETDVNVIIAISVSVIGVVALILLVTFLYLIRKRQKQMSYGQRCRPVSLDAYSLDNVSVLGSVRRKGVMRASKRSYGNIAFDDPSLRHNVLSASELVKFVERRSSIFEEFRDIPQIIARPDEVPQGCEDKNRYANVIPLPETRVILQQQGSDEKTEYINANYVRGPKDTPNYYIACQAPLESTVFDFWRMIWEQQSRVIVQATDLSENGIEKCAEYLPPSVTLDNHTTYGDFQVTLKHREVKDKYAISTILLKNTVEEKSRELTHYWYKWPEAGVPSEEAPIIAMLLEARSSLKSYAIEQSNELKEKTSTVTLKAEDSSVIDGSAATAKPVAEKGEANGSTVDASNGEINGNVAMEKTKGLNKNQGPLTIHCSPGTGRTGTIIACDMAIRSLETPKRSVDIPQIVYYVRRGRASAVQTKEQYEFIYKVANMYATKITNLSNDN